jgi:flagellar basal body-associated protein FliL
MIRIILIVVALIVVLGAGIAGVSMFAPELLPDFARSALGVQTEEPVVEEKPTGPPPIDERTMIELAPLTLPIFKNGELSTFLTMDILIITDQGEGMEQVMSRLPYIRDGVISYVHALSALEISPGIEDREFLKERLFAKIQEIAGKENVFGILFRNIFEVKPG